jgi:hypothetical protein
MRKLLKLTYIYGAHMNKSHAHIFYDRSNHTDYIGAKTLKHQSSSMTGSSNTILLALLLSLAVSTEWHLRCCEVVTEWLEWQGSSVGWSTCLDLMSARVPSEFCYSPPPGLGRLVRIFLKVCSVAESEVKKHDYSALANH